MRRDPLTNVSNRIAYEDKEKYLQAEINSETGMEFAIAVFDVNNLKLVNDSYGHDAGDEYLIRACQLICNVFKHSPVYRIGGDEFVVVSAGKLTGNDGRERISAFERFLADKNASQKGRWFDITASIGYVCFPASEMEQFDEKLKEADRLMYEYKSARKKQRGE